MADLNLGQLFAEFQQTAWRLATLDTYDVPEEAESLAAWKTRRTLRARGDGWHNTIKAAADRGARIARVQVFNRPLTDYAQFVMAAYGENVTAGEEIRVAYRDAHPDHLEQLNEDFWVFDNRTVAVMQYDPVGRFLGVEDGTKDIVYFRAIQRQALDASTPIGRIQVA